MIIEFNSFPSAFVPQELIRWVCMKTGFFFNFSDHSSGDHIHVQYVQIITTKQSTPAGTTTLLIPCQSIIPQKKIYDHLYIKNHTPIPIISPIRSGKGNHPLWTEIFSTGQGAVLYQVTDQTYMLSFDIFYNIWYHLYRMEEADNPEFKSDHSLLKSVISKPVVDYFIIFLRNIIEKIAEKQAIPLIRKSRWPQGKTFAVALSHDIDLTRRTGPFSFLKNLLFSGSSLKDRILRFVELIPGQNPYWTFPKLLELYQQHSVKASFFFLSKRFENLHFRYNIASRKFKKLFTELTQKGHEIGLHSSKYSFSRVEMVEWEKQRLQHILRVNIEGIRQHYLKCYWPRGYRFFHSLGFKYDSSMAYSEKAGYRCGTSLPFPVEFSPGSKFYEIPFYLFDYHLKKIDNVKQFLQDSIAENQKCEGLMHVLWHPSNLAVSPLNEYFFLLIRLLSDLRDQLWNATLEEIVSWDLAFNSVTLEYLDQATYRLYSPLPVKNIEIKELTSSNKSIVILDLKNNTEFNFSNSSIIVNLNPSQEIIIKLKDHA